MASAPTADQRDALEHAAGMRQQRPSTTQTQFRPMTFPRKRALTACESCRKRRTRCDNVRPVCSTCLKHSLPCSYDPRLGHSSFDPASLLIIDKLNQALQKLDDLSQKAASGLSNIQLPGDAVIDNQEVADQDEDDDDDDTNLLDCLEVPSDFATVDCMLAWPIFGSRWPKDYLSKELHADYFRLNQRRNSDSTLSLTKHRTTSDEAIPELVDRFLQLVHSKNPILHARYIQQEAKAVAENGLGWDAPSCLVVSHQQRQLYASSGAPLASHTSDSLLTSDQLLASALGTVAVPYNPSDEAGQLHGRSSWSDSCEAQNQAEGYYHLARKRIGLLDNGLVACQCHLLSGVYLMYTSRPLQAYSSFHNAASMLSLYLKGKATVWDRNDGSLSATISSDRRLEQRLYWTCLKTECEVKVHLGLPQSDLCYLSYPYLFPSPPTPSSPVQGPQDSSHAFAPTPSSANTTSSGWLASASRSSHEQSEEQSWFYYLSEIALRRLENRVLNAFYKADHSSWLSTDLQTLISAAEDIEARHNSWYSSLPSQIRFDDLAADEAMDELRFVTQKRSSIIRGLLYRPFLYYAVHCDRQLDPQSSSRLNEFVQKALEVCPELSCGEGITHRHHGSFYGVREAFGASLMLIAANKAGLVSWTAPSASQDLPDSHDRITPETQYGRAVRVSMERMQYWGSAENADATRCLDIVRTLLGVDAGL